ncbi:hypothetical protein ACFV8T_39935 [Streptomyces sp. NPDC059832]|uniref:hypothetical protein n=1 Tax=Streptomyces sp. NPDC059832 TaxID=3346966 RepID=UPI003661543D
MRRCRPALPAAWELDHLRDVLQALRRAQAGEPGTSDLSDLIQGLQEGPLRCTVDQCFADLQRVVAVLALGGPAVRTVATALALGLPHGLAVRESYDQVKASGGRRVLLTQESLFRVTERATWPA